MVNQLTNALPAGLRTPENFAKVKLATKQWSQLTAWSWSSTLAFADSPEAIQEQELKEFFRTILQNQAQYRSSAINYGDEESAELATAASETIKNFLAGDYSEIPPLASVRLTLSDVLKQLTQTASVFVAEPDFLDLFTFEVMVNEFTGIIREDQEKPGKYIAYLPYPPRPVFSEATFTEADLEGWLKDNSGNYFPPSPYIPMSGS